MIITGRLQRLPLGNGDNNSCHVDQIPYDYQEYFILSGYRKPYTTVRQCLKSTIQWNNELFNIWTHLLSALLFSLYLYMELQTLSPSVYTLPYLMLIGGAILITVTSTFAHTFNVLNDNARHTCFMLDYYALSVHSLFSSLVVRAYSFPYRYANTYFADIYMPMATVASVYTTFFSCRSRFVRLKSELAFQVMRISSFVLPFLLDNSPLFYRLLYGRPDRMEYEERTISLLVIMYVFAGASTFLYCSHIPERLWPGKFDVVGHSHSLFHCTTSLGMYIQILAARSDLLYRADYLKGQSWSMFDCWYIVPTILINLSIVAAFMWSFSRRKSSEMKRKRGRPNHNNNIRFNHPDKCD